MGTFLLVVGIGQKKGSVGMKNKIRAGLIL
jgi:hypothetical protein